MNDAPRLTPQNRLALLMHDALDKSYGKMGFGLMRYGAAPTVVVIDRSQVGQSVQAITGIPCDAPVVGSLREALAFGPDTLVPAIAPPGGALPDDWMPEIEEALRAGLSLVNGLHAPMANDLSLAPLVQPGRFIWDLRQEPPGLDNGAGLAREVSAKRVLLVGTDMANGKMTAALELDRAAQAHGWKSRFLASGQIGIAIAGEGMPLDGVRVDFASGAVEQMVLTYGNTHDVLWIEGQGSLLNPASTATLPLIRGSMPTHLILTHRAGQEVIGRCPWVRIPLLRDVIALYELVASGAGCLPAAHVAGIALNTAHLDDETAHRAIEETRQETGLPVVDVLRTGAGELLHAVMG